MGRPPTGPPRRTGRTRCRRRGRCAAAPSPWRRAARGWSAGRGGTGPRGSRRSDRVGDLGQQEGLEVGGAKGGRGALAVRLADGRELVHVPEGVDAAPLEGQHDEAVGDGSAVTQRRRVADAVAAEQRGRGVAVDGAAGRSEAAVGEGRRRRPARSCARSWPSSSAGERALQTSCW